MGRKLCESVCLISGGNIIICRRSCITSVCSPIIKKSLIGPNFDRATWGKHRPMLVCAKQAVSQPSEGRLWMGGPQILCAEAVIRVSWFPPTHGLVCGISLGIQYAGRHTANGPFRILAIIWPVANYVTCSKLIPLTTVRLVSP